MSDHSPFPPQFDREEMRLQWLAWGGRIPLRCRLGRHAWKLDTVPGPYQNTEFCHRCGVSKP